MTQLEGSGASRLLGLFRPDTKPVSITLATVKTLPPEISVRVDGDTVDTPHEGIIVAEHITEHKRTITFDSDVIRRQMTTYCDLQIEDRVIVAIADDGQLVYVLDKAVM